MNYTFEPKAKRPRYASYRLEDLRCMTLMQLRDICERETIIHAAIDRLDIEELIQVIMTFRGSRERFLLQAYDRDKLGRLQQALERTAFSELPTGKLTLTPSKISVFTGLDVGYFDDYRVSYLPELDGVNAFVLGRNNEICAVLRVVSFPGSDDLFLTRLAEFPCGAAEVRDYRLLLCPQELSDRVEDVYEGRTAELPAEVRVYITKLLEFEVCEPETAQMPLAIDFGTTNTAAGVYLSRMAADKLKTHMKPGQLLPDSVNYLRFLTPEGGETPVLPTIIGVDRITDGVVHWRYGFDAEAMTDQGYLGQGVCVFYDIKRWAADFEENETLTDGEGRQQVLSRKAIIKAYVDYIIQSAEQRFKCKFKKLFLSYPVKQRERFISLYRELFSEYELMEDEMFDEGVAVLYSIIGGFIDRKAYRENAEYHALILDCGGGTTDQSSATFSIKSGRAAFEINVVTAYENGDTDFGGNNLTFRIMQLLKIEAARLIGGGGESIAELAAAFSSDQYRLIDEQGKDGVYRDLEAAYARAESVIPTRYRDYEYSGRESYYKVYNNFYYLFNLAERVKKAFFESDQIMRIVVSSETEKPQPDTVYIKAERWKLAAADTKGLNVRKSFPTVSVNTHQVRAVFQADIYDIFRRFVGRLYEEKQLSQYQIVKLTGQSCKIGLFRDCLKEYVPGVLISQAQSAKTDRYQLKLTCLEGAIRYLRDKILGYAHLTIRFGRPALPYILSAYSHNGDKIILIHPLDRERVSGMVSRYIASSEVELTLSDAQGQEKYVYSVDCDPAGLRQVTYREIEDVYGERIPQAEVDVIENGEVRYFVWAESGEWGFSLVPVARNDENLRLGSQKLLSFENEGWLVNYFDGLH